MTVENHSKLWLADALYDLDAIQFGDFTVGRTAIGSPVYINVRRLIGHPTALWRAAHVIHEEITTLQSMRNRHMDHFDLVAGVPLGGLFISTAYSLTAKVPMIYLQPTREGSEIEGAYQPGHTAIIMDDLVTGGGSIFETAERLRESGLLVKDAYVLVDRQQGARERLHHIGINLRSCLTLEVILNHLRYTNKISDEWHRRSLDYLLNARPEPE
jgi:orotate phosphoribosyltransferase